MQHGVRRTVSDCAGRVYAQRSKRPAALPILRRVQRENVVIRSILFVLLLIVPIAEIAVCLTVGSAIGVLPTLLIIIATAVLGAALLKRQGVAAFARLQSDMKEGRVPAAAIGQAITVGIAGVLLLTPGFITDAVGFLLFIPKVRAWLWQQISGSVKVYDASGRTGSSPFGGGSGSFGGSPFGGSQGARPRPGNPRVIDLEAEEVRQGPGSGSSGTDPSSDPDPSTPWRQGPRD